MRKYQNKSNRGSWTDGQMYLAIQSVKNGRAVSYAAKEYGVPRTTLSRKRIEYESEIDDPDHDDGIHREISFKQRTAGFHSVFTADQEAALLNYLLQMERNLMGLTATDVRRLAYQLAEKLGVPHSFNTIKGLAGKDWFVNFKTRHNLTLRKSEPTSRARANGFTQESVFEFFDIYEKKLEEKKIDPSDVHNVDESPVTVNPKQNPIVVARKGTRRVGGLTAAERGKTVTAELHMSAKGEFMPPMLIFPLKNRKEEYLKGAPPGAWAEFSPSGWVDWITFMIWFVKFVEFSKASKDHPVMLVLDGHVSHVRNLAVIDYANAHGVTILCFPPHCTHKMQPLDTGFMKPLSDAYTQEVTEYQRKWKKTVTMDKIFELFGNAWKKAKKPEIATKAFAMTGLVPVDRTVFKDSDFVNLATPFAIPSSEMSAETLRCSQLIDEIQNAPAQQNAQRNAVPATLPTSCVPSREQNLIVNLAQNLISTANQLLKLVTPADGSVHDQHVNEPLRVDASENADPDSFNVRGVADLLGMNGMNEAGTPQNSPTTSPADQALTMNPPSRVLVNRPKGRAFEVTDENHRQSLIAAQEKKANKPSKSRKRKDPSGSVDTDPKKQPSTDPVKRKAVRSRRKVAPSTQEMIPQEQQAILDYPIVIPPLQSLENVNASGLNLPIVGYDEYGNPVYNIECDELPSNLDQVDVGAANVSRDCEMRSVLDLGSDPFMLDGV